MTDAGYRLMRLLFAALIALSFTSSNSLACAMLPPQPTEVELQASVRIVAVVERMTPYVRNHPEDGANLIIRIAESSGSNAPAIGWRIALHWPPVCCACYSREPVRVGDTIRENLNFDAAKKEYSILWRANQ